MENIIIKDLLAIGIGQKINLSHADRLTGNKIIFTEKKIKKKNNQ